MKKIVAMILWMLLVSGCALKQTEVETYTIDLDTMSQKQAKQFQRDTLKVMPLTSYAIRLSKKIHYSAANYQIGTYQESEWITGLDKLLETVLVKSLQANGTFKTVVPYTSSATFDYRLEGEVIKFLHQIRDTRSTAEVEIHLSLIRHRDGKIVKSKHFTYTIPTETIDAAGYVKAVNHAMVQFHRDFLAWIAHE